MNNRNNESFSAFLDGEASEVDIQRLLKALDQDPQILEQWERLSRVQASMAGDTLVNVATDSVVEESRQHDQPGKPKAGWRLRLGQGTVAAAVALVVVAGAHWRQGTPEVTGQVAEGPDLEASQTHFEVQQRFNSYLRQHAEAASYSSGHVVVPYELYWETSK